MTAIRPFLVAVLGILSAFVLFWVMQALVSVKGELKESTGKLTVDFVRLRKDTTPPMKEREPPRREKPEQPPPPPEMNMAQNLKPGDTVGEIVPMIDTGMELESSTSLGVGGTDRDVVPLVRVDPEYPPRAQQQRIGGWVEVSFTITPVGTVDDIKVTGSDPPYVFDRAVVEAVRKWRYNPKIEDGKAVARKNQRVRLRFDPRASSR
jgi:protein TonB